MPDREVIGSPSTLLVIVRGPSGAGKSSVARAVRERYGRGMAVVGQDHLRREILWEQDVPGGLAPAFIVENVRFLLDSGWPVVLEGILTASRYGKALRELVAAHQGRTLVYFLDVELEETFARHATRPQAEQFTTSDMASWYIPGDLLSVPGEVVIPQSSSLEQTVGRICCDARILSGAG